MVNYTVMTNPEEIEILRDRTVFNYQYDAEGIGLLKKNFSLKDSLYLLAKNDDRFAGFCSIDRDWREDGYFFLREILVDLNARWTGIWNELMWRCIKHAKLRWGVGVVTETAFDNLPMQWLCTKLGFTEWDNPVWKEWITYKLIF